MYSKNDYRYYLENQLIHSDDFLDYYGVDSLYHARSHKYIKKIGKRYFYTQKELEAFLREKNPKNNYKITKFSGEFGEWGGPNGQTRIGTVKAKDVGIQSKKNPSKYLAVGSTKATSGKKTVDLYFSPTKKLHYMKKGRLMVSTGEEGSHVSLDVTKKKREDPKKKYAQEILRNQEIGKAISKGTSKSEQIARNASKNSTSKKGKVSEEYLKELLYNSKRNRF